MTVCRQNIAATLMQTQGEIGCRVIQDAHESQGRSVISDYSGVIAQVEITGREFQLFGVQEGISIPLVIHTRNTKIRWHISAGMTQPVCKIFFRLIDHFRFQCRAKTPGRISPLHQWEITTFQRKSPERCLVFIQKDEAVVIIAVHGVNQSDLFDVAGALYSFCLDLGCIEGRQQQTRQNGNDRNDYQKFDERE